jgi:class 3 adenylate cyclase/tetratricopeptide (TPR) repeat protein
LKVEEKTPPAEPPSRNPVSKLTSKEQTAKTEAERSSQVTEGERRVVTILFCDVKGSTEAAEQLDPEEWTEIMNGAFEHMIRPVDQYEGTIARLMGDAVLAFFGAPVAHEDDPQRAVLAGLDIVNDIQTYRAHVKREWGIDLNVRVGINTGLTVVADVGSEKAAEYTAMGDAVNVAARMEQTAKPGTVQITHETYMLVAPLFECKPLGGISVKGKSKPIFAYQVLARKAEPGSLRGLGGLGISSPLVGREREFAIAHDALTRLLEGEGGFLMILGEAGIGKSRLLAELRAGFMKQTQASSIDPLAQATNNSPLIWLEGNTLPYGKRISYWPFQEILKKYAGINEEDGESEAWCKLEASIGSLFPEETAEILPYLASLLALKVTEEYAERVKYLDGEALGRQVYRASRRFFQRLAEQTPLVLVFDDLHWMDTSSAGLLEHLLPLTESVPLLICSLSRPDPESPALRLREIAAEEYGDRFIEIDLHPLSPTNSDWLVHNLLDIDGLPAHLRQRMVNKADGNPFFLEEIVRDLIEAGALVHDPSSGRWQATVAAEKVSVPDTIQGLIMARIDRLEDDLKRVIRRAAVIGRSFLYRILNAVLTHEDDLEGQLDQLQRVELIREKQQIPELEYIFKHALAQETTYDSILLQERREVHSRVGAAIETLMADRLEEFYGLLAYHYSAAEQWEQAQKYLFKAGDQAGRMAADAEALTHYRQAMEAYARARGDDWEPIERARLERKIGEALYRLGQHMQARPYLERSLVLLGEGLPSSRWGTRLAIAGALLTQVAHRILPQVFVRPMEGSLDPVAEEIYLTSMALGEVELLADQERYLLLNIRALNTSERLGYAYGSATLAANMGTAAVIIDRFGWAENYFRLSAAYAQKVVPHRPIPQLETGLASKSNLLADFEKMREHALRGMEIAQQAGSLRLWGMAMIHVAYSYWGQGRYKKASEACEQLLRSAEESSDRQLVAWGLLALGCIQQRRGLANEAIVSHQRVIEIAEDLPDWATLAGAGGWMGRSYLALGKVDRALDIMELTQEIFFAKSSGNLLGYVYLGNGLALAYLTKAEETEGKVNKAWLKKAKDVCRQTLKGARQNRMALPDAQRFQGSYLWLSGKPKKAQKWWARALSRAEDTGMRYEEAMIHMEIGRHLGDHEHLQYAVSVLEDIGAEFALTAAREALQNLGVSE